MKVSFTENTTNNAWQQLVRKINSLILVVRNIGFMYTTVQQFSKVSKILFFKKLTLLFNKDDLNWTKVTVKKFYCK